MAGEMSREEFLHHLYGNMTAEELAQLTQYGQDLFQAAAKAANDGNHRYDWLGATSEQIATDTKAILEKQQQQGNPPSQ